MVQLQEPFWANLAPTWRPKWLPNRGQKLKKSKLKNKLFLASIFKGFGPRFGRVFGRFFGPKTHAESDLKSSARQAKTIGKTNTKSMSQKRYDCSSIFARCFSSSLSSIFWKYAFRLDGSTIFKVFAKIAFYKFHAFLVKKTTKNLSKTKPEPF